MTQISAVFGEGQTEASIAAAAALVENFLQQSGLNQNRVVQGMKEGLTPAQAMGLGRDDLELLYALGFDRLSAGNTAGAHEVFSYLAMIDPLHAPNFYCLGVAELRSGRPAEAETCFTKFLALDATHVAGYLRYGECRMAQADAEGAREAYCLALKLCQAGHGDETLEAETTMKLSMLSKGGTE